MDFNEDVTQQFNISQVQCKYVIELGSDKQIEIQSVLNTEQIYAQFSNIFRCQLNDIQLVASHQSLLDNIKIEVVNTTGFVGQSLPVSLTVTSTSDALDITTLQCQLFN